MGTIKTMSARIKVKLFDFRIYNEDLTEESEEETYFEKKDKKETVIQMFGMNKLGKTFAINVMNFKPFFYVKVPQYWDIQKLKIFERNIKKDIGKYYSDSIGKFKNTSVFNKVKALWYTEEEDYRKRNLRKAGHREAKLYEAKLPPLLRFFHIKEISPSGWISFNESDIDSESSETCCDYEYWIDYDDIKAEKTIEEAIPLKICSFDIEASSSHGDFPLAKKTYLKLCREIVTYWRKNKIREKNMEFKQSLFKELVNTAFGYETNEDMSKLFIKKSTRISKA